MNVFLMLWSDINKPSSHNIDTGCLGKLQISNSAIPVKSENLLSLPLTMLLQPSLINQRIMYEVRLL